MAMSPSNTPCRSPAKSAIENCKTQPEPQRDFNFFSWTTIRNMDKKGRFLGFDELYFTFCANCLMRTHSINCVFWTGKLRGSHWIEFLRDIYRKCCESFYCFVNQNPFTFFILAALLWIHSHYALYHYSRLKPLYQYLLIISGLCKVWCMYFVLCMCVYSYKDQIYL